MTNQTQDSCWEIKKLFTICRQIRMHLSVCFFFFSLFFLRPLYFPFFSLHLPIAADTPFVLPSSGATRYSIIYTAARDCPLYWFITDSASFLHSNHPLITLHQSPVRDEVKWPCIRLGFLLFLISHVT